MQITQKARVRVPATTSPLHAAARVVLEKAIDAVDGLDIDANGQRPDADFQRGLNRIPSERESPTGRSLDMSGSGAEDAIGEYSMPAEQKQLLMRTYNDLTDRLERRVAHVEKAVGALLAERAGISLKAVDWESTTAEKDEDESDEASARATEKAIAAGKSVSVKDVLGLLAHRANHEPLRSPPDMTAGSPMRKAALAQQDFSDTLQSLTPAEHMEAMALQARLARVGHVDGLTVEKAMFGISSNVISKCFSHLAR